MRFIKRDQGIIIVEVFLQRLESGFWLDGRCIKMDWGIIIIVEVLFQRLEGGGLQESESESESESQRVSQRACPKDCPAHPAINPYMHYMHL